MLTLGVYVYTLCPTVFWDDAGELIAACYTLGIPHPPGHPLYAILGKLFTLIPVGSPAYRVNLMSAFFGALTCVTLYEVVRELALRDKQTKRFAGFAGIIIGLGTAFSGILWDQSIIAETTSLHSFFMLIVTLLAFRIYADGPDDPRLTRRLLAFSFIYGLSFTNHVAGLFFAPSLTIILLAGVRVQLFRPGRLSLMFALFAVGLSVYAYLPLSSMFDPPVDWGNPETLENFLWVITAKQYSSNLVRVPTLVGLVRGLRNISHLFITDLSLIGCGFAIVGIIKLWKEKKSVIAYGAVIILILFLTSLNSAFIVVYLLPAVLMLAIWGGFGLAFLCHKAEHVASTFTGMPRRLVAYSAYGAGILFVLIQIFVHFPENNKREYVYAREYGMELLSPLPENAVLITGSAEPLFISWYLQYCENFRTDVKVITRNGLVRPGYLNQIRDQYPELEIPREFQREDDEDIRPSHINERGDGLPWYANSYFKLFYDLNVSKFPIFWEGIESNQLLMERFVPYHLVFRILPSGQAIDLSNNPDIPNADEIAERIDHDPVAGRVYGNHFFNFAVYHQWHSDFASAEQSYEDSLKLHPKDTRALNNLGAFLAGRGDMDAAAEIFSRAFQVGPNDATSNHNVGQMMLDRGEADKAIPFFRRAIANDPGNFEDYYNLGLCYSATGKNRQALDMFQMALLVKPESPEAISSLGVAYLRVGETENAEKFLKTALELEPDNAENWYNLSCLKVLEGDKAASIEHLKAALTLDYQRIYNLASKDARISPLLNTLQDIPSSQ